MRLSFIPNNRPELHRRSGSLRRTARAGLSVVTLICGCVAQPSANRPQIAPYELAQTDGKTEMEERIRGFIDYFRSTVDRTATEIEQKAASRDVRQAAAVFRVRLGAQCRAAADQADPGEVLLDLWTLTYRLADYLSTGNGAQVFGDQQPVALRAAREIQAAIDELARKSIADKSFDRVHQDVITYAREHPMQEGFAGQPVEYFSDKPQGRNALQQLIEIPLAPIVALGGVGRTPESVHAVARSVDRFTDVVDDFPANARLQIQLLGTNLSRTPEFSDTMASVRQFSDNSTRLVDVAETMPKSLRTEAETLLDRVDKSQPELRSTLGETQRTAGAISSASADIRQTTIEARTTLAGVQEASQALEKASQSVGATAREILKFVPASMKDETGQIIGETPAEAEPAISSEDTSFSFQAVTRSADALGQTTDKLQSLLAELKAFLDGNLLSREVGNVDAQLRTATDAASLSVRGIIDHIAKRTAQLLLLFFALLVVSRLINRRPKPAKPAS